MILKQKKNLLATLVVVFIIGISSCTKEQKVLKDVAGTWTIESVLSDGKIDDRTFEGSWTFDNCKMKESNKFNCNGMFNYTVTYMGNTQSATNTFKYKTIKNDNKDVQLILEDATFNISFPDEKLVLETLDSNPTQKITFTK